ncbi:GNAT family N-acetyltransferase [Flavivirga aquimarina]|uniref:GNAT family N-acetyltransferase n=1 Tax=Flavivirga aquimarina TaxID=2027862 RepID=A0ABT8WDL3_9FLAO|nr:GNAT family N-acetyltransferase [Flavivirga aquimarina]MDO5971139.1 GNAT family N-acetyltransferase [Flavivirga aquimarina]
MLSIFLENRNALPLYATLFNTISNEEVYKNDDSKLNNGKAQVVCIYDFPNYLKGNIKNSQWKTNTINSFKGSMIVLKNYTNVEDYLKHNFSSKRRSKFRTYQKRLETAFNITYKTYCGHIDLEDYETLFKQFHALIERRFVEKKMKNYDLTRWDVYHKIAYPLIQNKEAALFVIYHDNKPISICLNLIRGHVIYGYIRAYDIDYSKFYLGFIDFIKQLHWCFENDIKIFDLLKGSYAYKAYLANDEYYFQKHVIYNTNNLLAKVFGQLLSFRIKSFYRLVGLLKKCDVDKLYHAFLNFRYRNEVTKKPLHYTSIKLKDHNFGSDSIKIQLNDNQYASLKRPVYDYLYKSQESVKDIELYKSTTHADTFFVKGNKSVQQISFLQP